MGIVWRGRDDLLDRDVAVKQIILAPMASATQAQASFERTLREAKTAARLSHPGVVTVFDVVEEDGMPWIVMELIRARPLDQVITEDGPLPPAQAAQLGLGLLDALTAAHAAGVLHRDVKPSNVLISSDGKAVLTDFGIATIQGDPSMTQAGMVVGTPGFSPPERVRGQVATAASDLWSLGATLYAAVEGRGPFDRVGGSLAIVASIATEPAPRAPSAGPLASVIDALLRSDPAERPDAPSVATMLAQALTLAQAAESAQAQASVPGQAAALASAAVADSDLAGIEATTATQALGVPGTGQGDTGLAGAGPTGGGLAGGGPAGSGPAGSGLAASPEVGPSSGARQRATTAATADSDAAASVVPDLMATPIFADLKMPAPQQPADLPQSADSFGAPDDSTSTRLAIAWRARPRRGLVVFGPVAVSAVVAGVVFLAFPGFGGSLIHGISRLSGNEAGSPAASNAGPGGLNRKVGGSAPGSGGSGGLSTPAAGNRPPTTPPSGAGKPTPSGKPSTSPSGQPSPSGSPTASGSPSPSVSPSPSPSSGSTLPSGYIWQSESAATAGTTAGFKLATPSSWLLTPGLHTRIAPLVGAIRLGVDMAPFAVQWPVKEARHLQAQAIAANRYPGYRLVSILAMRFHGSAAATWTFSWKPALSSSRTDVTAVIFTAKTTAGPQPYVLSISAPAPHAAWASYVLRVAMRTFTPLP